MLDPASVDASRQGEKTLCSWDLGWRSLLLRGFDEPREVEEMRTAPTQDHLIVLVTRGTCTIEALSDGRWSRASYRAGHLGMTAPREESVLRWKGPARHGTLQLHLPAAIIDAVSNDLRCRGYEPHDLPNDLSTHDTAVERVMLTLADAARSGAPDLYAETAAHFLAVHLLGSRPMRAGTSPPPRNEAALRRVEDYMRAHIADGISLDDLADVAGYSRFQLVRLAMRLWGEPPFRRLLRLRMDLARLLLANSPLPIGEIALRCGYGTSAHFTTAFRRHVGTTPSEFRRR